MVMAEPCDPAVLHARLSVVESDSLRHEGDISKIWEGLNRLDICAASLPKIESTLAEIIGKVDDLRISIATRDATVKADLVATGKNKPFLEKWQSLLAPIMSSIFTGLIIFGLLLYLHVFGGT
jgi:hypothetical protein